jgi:hypothetical protein
MQQQPVHWALTDLSQDPDNFTESKIAALIVTKDKDGRDLSTYLPISSLQMEYALNSIPRINLICPLGKRADNGELSPVYGQIENMKRMARIAVISQGDWRDWSPEGKDGQKIPWSVNASSNATLFTGYVVHLNFRREAKSIALQITASSQLIDLTMSAVGNSTVLPGSPTDLLTQLNERGGGIRTDSSPYSVSTDVLFRMKVDMADGLLNSMLTIASEPLQLHVGQTRRDDQKNARAIEVIKGSPGFSSWGWKGIGLSSGFTATVRNYVKPYPIQIPLTSSSKLATIIGRQFNSSVAGASFWDVLVGAVLPQIGMALIPMANFAVVAPVMPLNRKHAVTIGTNEYVDWHAPTMSQRPLRAVALYGRSTTGAGTDRQTFNTAGSFYPVEALEGDPEEITDGQWMFAPLPPWLDDVINHNATRLLGLPKDRQLMSTPVLSSTTVAEPEIQGQAQLVNEVVPQEELIQSVTEYAEASGRYAQMLYVANVLRGRDGMLTGKLRFDIAPGCTIKIKGTDNYIDPTKNEDAAGERSEGGNLDLVRDVPPPTGNKLSHDCLAFVNKVTITIDSQSARATTSFVLSNIRTVDENNSRRFSLTEHPFFGENFFEYAPIVPGLSQPLPVQE